MNLESFNGISKNPALNKKNNCSVQDSLYILIIIGNLNSKSK